MQGQSLRQAAENDGLLVGSAVRPSQLTERAYFVYSGSRIQHGEAEDAMKRWGLRPDQNSFDFRQDDELVGSAQAHPMKVRGHCLIWDHNNPDWLTHGQFTSPQLSRLLHEHINRVMKHYAGRVFAWAVVNEALEEKGNIRESIWYNRPGIGFSEQGTNYIAQVFRWTHKADPTALLFYNEAEGEALNRKSDALYAMVRDFGERGVPSRCRVADAPTAARCGYCGIRHITELDVSLPVLATDLPASDPLPQSDLDALENSHHAPASIMDSGQFAACTR
jgi:endo-1,4-beta-xylanase